MRILIDLDGICCDLLSQWLKDYNAKYRDALTKDDVVTFKMADIVKPEAKRAIYDMIKEPGYFRYLPPIAGAREAVKALDATNEVRLISSPIGIASYSDKAAWVEDEFGMRRDMLMLVPSHEKHWVRTDVIIDDKPSTIKAFANYQPGAHRITIAYPYNQEVENVCSLYAQDYDHTEQAWETIVQYLEEIAQ